MLHVTQLLLFPRNLQAAIGAYYDFESPNINAPCMSFVRDVTIGEGESVPPDTPFTKTWRIQNTGLLFMLIKPDCCQEGGPRPRRADSRLVPVAFRCRVVASWGLSEVCRRRSVWSREHGDGAFAWPSGNDWRQRADAKPHVSRNVPGPVEDVHGYGAVLRGYVPSLIFNKFFFLSPR